MLFILKYGLNPFLTNLGLYNLLFPIGSILKIPKLKLALSIYKILKRDIIIKQPSIPLTKIPNNLPKQQVQLLTVISQ
jgi:hypothetical protein